MSRLRCREVSIEGGNGADRLPDDPLAHLSNAQLDEAVQQAREAQAAQHRADRIREIDAHEAL
jgi:hypothetical protein